MAKRVHPYMNEISPTKVMVEQAELLKEGKILIVYRDFNTIRMETESGQNPYVWRSGCWKPMIEARRENGKT